MFIIIGLQLVYNFLFPKHTHKEIINTPRSLARGKMFPIAKVYFTEAFGAFTSDGYHRFLLLNRLYSLLCDFAIIFIQFNPDKIATEFFAGDSCGARTHKWVKDGVAFV